MLHYLPFHCLYDGTQYVVERLNISYLPAAALWEICRQRGERVESRKARLCDSLVLGISDGGRLQFAVQEAEVVAKQLGTRPMLDNAATASLLWQSGARSPIVHIAAHGLFRLDALRTRTTCHRATIADRRWNLFRCPRGRIFAWPDP